MTQHNDKQHCFFCGREYYDDDPEFDPNRRICDHCAEDLENDNPYSYRLPQEWKDEPDKPADHILTNPHVE